MANFIDILPEKSLLKILLDLPPLEIGNACQLNKRIANICHNDKFWKAYAKYRGIENVSNETWKEAVRKSAIGYVHVDLSTQLAKKRLSLLIRSILGQNLMKFNMEQPVFMQ